MLFPQVLTGLRRVVILGVVAVLATTFAAIPVAQAREHQGFVDVPGARLEYVDWGGKGPTLIFVPGLGDDPHGFDDLAPAFTGCFHVVSYARRGQGLSSLSGPYDNATLTRDLDRLMTSLGVKKAVLAGYSMGGNESTQLAIEEPDRVIALVYLDGAYDWADPAFAQGYAAFPQDVLKEPDGARDSLKAYTAFLQKTRFAGLHDTRRLSASLREQVILDKAGHVSLRVSDQVNDALLASLRSNPPRDYRRIKAPILAIYAQEVFDPSLVDAAQRRASEAWEARYMEPYRQKSIALLRAEAPAATVVRVPGGHGEFLLTSRSQVVGAMKAFFERQALCRHCQTIGACR